MFYEPRNGHGLPHDPFRAIVAPRPIGWISTVCANGVPNLAPYSFFNAVCGTPPMVGFASETKKDSANNAEATGEFVVNLATMPLAEAVNASSARFSSDVNEFDQTGLAPAPCRLVKAFRVAASPAALECKVTQILHLLDLDGNETDRHFVIGQVVGVHIDETVLTDGLFDAVKAKTIARMGYRDYTEVTDIFTMLPPPHVFEQH